MVGMPGLLARLLTRVFGHGLGLGFWGKENIVYNTTGTERYSVHYYGKYGFTVLLGRRKSKHIVD